jgi:hypothetical protein
VEEGKKASKSMLSDTSKVSRQAERDLLFEQVASHWRDGNFIYATHDSWTKHKNGKVRVLDRLNNVLSVGVKSHGQNQYTSFTRVAALTVCQFPYAVRSILSKLSNKDSNTLNLYFKVESVYQTIGRTAIRTHQFLESDQDIEAIVLDRETAEKLSEIFVGSEIVGRIGSFSRRRKKRSDASGLSKVELTYLSKKKASYKLSKVPPKQERTKNKICEIINANPKCGYKLSDFGL